MSRIRPLCLLCENKLCVPGESGHAAGAAELAVAGVQLHVAVAAPLVFEDAVAVRTAVRLRVVVNLQRRTNLLRETPVISGSATVCKPDAQRQRYRELWFVLLTKLIRTREKLRQKSKHPVRER